MGRTTYKGNPALQIVTEGVTYPTVPLFAPGNTIIGRVCRRAALVSTEASVQITLCGRAKSKITVRRHNAASHGTTTTHYRGRFTLIDEDAHRQTIFNGPLHVADSSDNQTWSFVIDIPTHCSQRKLVNSVPANLSFLPLDAASVAIHRLPGTFDMDHSGWSSDREGFVEYWLEATILFIQHGKQRSETATLPIIIASANNDPPITDFGNRRYRELRVISSFRLLPNMEAAELTFQQKCQQLFGSSKVPRAAGKLELYMPRIMQLGNPSTVPLRLRFVPDKKLSSDNMHDIPIKIVLQSLRMTLMTKTTVRCAAAFSPREASDDTEITLNIWPPSPGQPSSILYIPCTGEYPPIDVGAKADFRLNSQAPRQALRKLYPRFTTYNLMHTHYFKFEIVATASGEEMKMNAFESVVILPASEARQAPVAAYSAHPGSSAVQQEEEAPPPPFQPRSESWIRPPAETDAPPTFAQAQEENVTRKSQEAERSTEAGPSVP
ncbi:hypothetical protein SODALDRAFT_188857 [Sodiomyces alkalinus F11]|uniref:Arrestin-like N-terminal domain-containing protein n=1 Tax=Sodiomyces alkalinus (strain CBS 110278 / VKM F-3762 / F11) TaxID=1314773 RepID=A0A3N2PRX9_SODAK|nr:hypothetical protein SODALDRAFT_188857 [Sodiomyces alkalinus F11]ROT37126.1 hypothetical protein SODALDRAFT_188857 [Sodiomyces alkalinus F11]